VVARGLCRPVLRALLVRSRRHRLRGDGGRPRRAPRWRWPHRAALGHGFAAGAMLFVISHVIIPVRTQRLRAGGHLGC
jgi:hypothetical protein